jgi:hypothetical protein
MLRDSENPHCCAIETFRDAQDLALLISRNACELAKGTLFVEGWFTGRFGAASRKRSRSIAGA